MWETSATISTNASPPVTCLQVSHPLACRHAAVVAGVAVTAVAVVETLVAAARVRAVAAVDAVILAAGLGANSAKLP